MKNLIKRKSSALVALTLFTVCLAGVANAQEKT